jgi:hypothetical protein
VQKGVFWFWVAIFATALNAVIAAEGLRIVTGLEAATTPTPASRSASVAAPSANAQVPKAATKTPTSAPTRRPQLGALPANKKKPPTTQPARTAGGTPPKSAPSPTPSPRPESERPRAPGEDSALTALTGEVRTHLVGLRFLLIEIVIVWLALLGAAMTRSPLALRRRLTRPGDLALLATQIVTIVAGITGALGRALWVEPRTDHVLVPVLDATTVLWLALVPIGLLLPRLQKFEFGGASFSISEAAPKVITDVAGLLENWLGALNLLMEWLPTDPLPSETIRAFLRDRSDEAIREMSTPGEYLRLAFWNYVDEVSGLKFLDSNQISDDATRDAVFRDGEGCLGMAFREGRVWNEKNPRALACWKKVPGGSTEYSGLLLVPITWGARKIGMLSVDREAAEEFDEVSVQIALSLAYLAANALGSPLSIAALQREQEAAVNGRDDVTPTTPSTRADATPATPGTPTDVTFTTTSGASPSAAQTITEGDPSPSRSPDPKPPTTP